MRAFDLQNWEYFGSNADSGWGPYTVETGWMCALIDIALCSYLLMDPLLPMEKDSRAIELLKRFKKEFEGRRMPPIWKGQDHAGGRVTT